MATKKITELTAANTLSSNSLLVAVTDPSGAATTKKITVANFFGNVSTNAAFNSNVSIAGTTTANSLTVSNSLIVSTGSFTTSLVIPYRSPPANSTAIAISNNSIFHDGNFLYVATANNVTKRVALTSF